MIPKPKDTERLARSLVAKLKARAGAMAIESTIAVGLMQPPEGFRCPHSWALSAARIASASWSKLLRAEDGPGPVQADQVGAFVAMAQTWQGYLKQPSVANLELEKANPALTELRMQVSELSQAQFSMAREIAHLLAENTLTAKERIESTQGQSAGASLVVDAKGELKDESSIRTEVCFFIWLFWDELLIFKTLADLEKFLLEFRVLVSRKNLERICADIGLSFRGRGRPKKPTKAKKTLGIKKSKTGVKRGHDNSRRRKKKSD